MTYNDCDHVYTVMAPPTVLGALLRCERCGMIMQLRFNTKEASLQSPQSDLVPAGQGAGVEGELHSYSLAMANHG